MLITLKNKVITKKILDVSGDGNCFYRAISVSLTFDENNYKELKKLLLLFGYFYF